MASVPMPPSGVRVRRALLSTGAEVAQLLGISDQTIYVWRRQHLIDTGQLPGTNSSDLSELAAARKRIAELEAGCRTAGRGDVPKRRFAAIRVMAREHLPVQLACRVLHVAESGYYAWRGRPSNRLVKHAWLTEAIVGIHTASRGTYGSRRVHAGLRLGLSIHVSHGTVELLMQCAGLHGLPGNRRSHAKHVTPSVTDLVERNFTRHARDQSWATDITEHPTLEGKVYCAVILDTFSRRVVGWSIDAPPTAALTTNALAMAIGNRQTWRTRLELSTALFEYLEIFHNRQRRHSALGMLSPVEYELRTPPVA